MKPWDDETDMKKLEEAVRSVQMEGLTWGACMISSTFLSAYLFSTLHFGKFELNISQFPCSEIGSSWLRY